MKTTNFSPYEILNSIFLLPVNEKKAKELEEHNAILEKHLDFYLAVYAEIENHNEDVFTKAMLPKNFFEKYVPGSTETMILEVARMNTKLKFSPVLLPVDFLQTFRTPEQMPIYDDNLALDMSPLTKDKVYALTTKDTYLYGTVNLTNDEVFDIICSRFESNEIYLACTSVHEIMIHSADMYTAEDIKAILSATIEEATEDNIKFTDTVYKYTYLKGLEVVA